MHSSFHGIAHLSAIRVLEIDKPPLSKLIRQRNRQLPFIRDGKCNFSVGDGIIRQR